MPNSSTLHLTLSPELKSKLDALARSKNESAPAVAVEAIASYVETYQWQLEEIARGLAEADAGGPFVEHERVVEWLRSWGTDDELPPPKPRD